MAVPQPYDVVETGADMLIDFWKDKPVVQGLLKSKLREVQKLEGLTFQVLNERNVNDAIGAQLDVVGSIVGENRLGRLDAPYRQAILTRIALNRSDGTPPVILDLLNILSGSPVPNIFEHYPASFIAYVDRGASHELAKTLKEISAAGVDVRLIFDWEGDSFVGCELEEESDLFQFEDNSLFSTDNGLAQPVFSTLGYKNILTGDRTFLPELDEDILNPMCEIFDSTQYQIEVGCFDTGDGSLFQFEDGSLFQWEEIEEI